MRRKLLGLFGGLVIALAIWWLATASHSDYHALEHADIRFANVTVASPNPQRLARFYQQVFEAVPLENGSGWALDDRPVQQHIRTPGYQGQGPTISIIASRKNDGQGPLKPQDHGYAHLCFEADDVPELVRRIRAAGGQIVSRFENNDRQPGIYATDPDGNVIEVHLPFATPVTPTTIARMANSLLRTVTNLAPPERNDIRFLHANINSADWQSTLAFFNRALGAEATGFERDYDGDLIRQITGLPNAVVKGQHAALPGYSAGGPTVEIFTYAQPPTAGPLGLADRGHLAIGFTVTNLQSASQRLQSAGAEVVDTSDGQSRLFRDPDGNLLQLRAAAAANAH